jgi:hypothetical protein
MAALKLLVYEFLNSKRRVSRGIPALWVGNFQRLQLAYLHQLLHHR